MIGAGNLPDHFYVLIKGLVEERAGDEVVAVHEGGDGFDSEILVYQSCRHDFFVREEAICYALPIEDFLELTANNTAFAAFFFKDISHKLERLRRRQASPQALGSMTHAGRVRRRSTRRCSSPPETDAARGGAAHGTGRASAPCWCAKAAHRHLHRRRSHARRRWPQRQPLETPVRDLVRYDVLGIDEDSFLFEAALLMARAQVRHLVVRREGEIVGVLDAANVLSSLANQADPIGRLIERAETPAELAEASERIGLLIRQLHDSGTKIGFITDLATDLHRRATAPAVRADGAARAWPSDACLIVMGSEGRGEYLAQDRPGQRHHPRRRLRAAGLGPVPPELHRRHDRGRLPALPGRDHGAQPDYGRSRSRPGATTSGAGC